MIREGMFVEVSRGRGAGRVMQVLHFIGEARVKFASGAEEWIKLEELTPIPKRRSLAAEGKAQP